MSGENGHGARRGLGAVRRVVVKIGSAVIAGEGTLDAGAVTRLARDVGSVLDGDARRRVVIVSSGAVASGYRALGRERPPKEIVGKQAAAAIGQPRLMSAWAEAFARHGGERSVAQVLLTAEDIDHRTRFLNARRTMDALLEAGIVPIVNENDSVSYAEIKLGDNDRLSSLVASLVDADLLVILSSVRGVEAPGERRKGERAIVPEIRSLADGLDLVRVEKTGVGTGGMETKIRAACEAAALGIGVVIASGLENDAVGRVLAGEPIGTYFPPAAEGKGRAARKRWIGFSARARGVLRVDEGARRAIMGRGASLLPSGVKGVSGEFDSGALVELAGPDGEVFARGLSAYASEELERILGRKTGEIAGVLGYCYAEEVVHRDDLALLDTSPTSRSPQPRPPTTAKAGKGGM